MSRTSLSQTTVTSAITGTQDRFAVGSTTGMNGLGSLTSPQSMLIVDDEAMLVLSVPVSGTVQVARGVGTKASPHAAAAIVYFAARTEFGPLESDRQTLTGDAGNPAGLLPAYGVPGTRVTRGGKIYVAVDFTATVHSGVSVGITPDFTAAPLVSGFQGPVGVVADNSATSDQMGWVQVYGSASAQEAGGTSAATSLYMPIIAGSVSSPNAGMAALVATTSTPQLLIYGMFITGAATTNVTSAASHTGVAVPVFLNFPYVLQTATDVGFS